MQKEDKKTSQVFDDFQIFRSEIGRITKKMIQTPDLRCIFYIQRNLQRSPLRQIEYVVELTNADQLIDVSSLSNGEFATPVAPNCPQIEEKTDNTLDNNNIKSQN